MKHVHRVLPAYLVLSLLAFSAAAQAPATIFSTAVRNAATVDPGTRQSIVREVGIALDRLIAARSDEMGKLRDQLAAEPRTSGVLSCSTDFQAAYVEAVASQAPARYAVAPNLRAKLNLAIVIGHVAEWAPNGKLEPAVLALLAPSEQPAVQIWGARAARFIMPDLAKRGSSANLVTAVATAAKAKPLGPLVDEAYEALKPTDAKSLALLAEPLLGLAEIRVGALRTGYPDDPILEFKPITFLGSTEALWSGLSATQQQRLLQLAMDAIVWGAYRADEQKANVTVREQIGQMMNKSAQALQVVALIIKSKATDSAGKGAADQLTVAAGKVATATSSVSSTTVYSNVVRDLPAAIKGLKDFARLSDPEAPSPAP